MQKLPLLSSFINTTICRVTTWFQHYHSIWFYGSEMKEKRLTRKKEEIMTLSLWFFPQTHITRSLWVWMVNDTRMNGKRQKKKCADSRSFHSLTDDQNWVWKYGARQERTWFLEQLLNTYNVRDYWFSHLFYEFANFMSLIKLLSRRKRKEG